MLLTISGSHIVVGPGNGSPLATNVVLVVVVLLRVVVITLPSTNW